MTDDTQRRHRDAVEGLAATEDAYWRAHYASRPYVAAGSPYERYRGAYRFGWEARARLADRSWDEAEERLRGEWADDPAADDLDWESARGAVRDAWERVPMQPGMPPYVV